MPAPGGIDRAPRDRGPSRGAILPSRHAGAHAQSNSDSLVGIQRLLILVQIGLHVTQLDQDLGIVRILLGEFAQNPFRASFVE